MLSDVVAHFWQLYPNGALFLFYAGRLHYVKGEFPQAIELYKRSWHSQDQWKQFHHVCIWELTWAALMTCDWVSVQTEFFLNLASRNQLWIRNHKKIVLSDLIVQLYDRNKSCPKYNFEQH